MLLARFEVLTTALMKIHILWNINHAVSTVNVCQWTERNIPAGLKLFCLQKYSIHIVHVHYLETTKKLGTTTCHSISSYSIPFHITTLFPLSVYQSTHRHSQQQLYPHSKPLSHTLLLCLLLRQRKRPLTSGTAFRQHAMYPRPHSSTRISETRPTCSCGRTPLAAPWSHHTAARTDKTLTIVVRDRQVSRRLQQEGLISKTRQYHHKTYEVGHSKSWAACHS